MNTTNIGQTPWKQSEILRFHFKGLVLMNCIISDIFFSWLVICGS